MKKPYFGRLLTAMVTPFNADGSINYEAGADFADCLIERSASGAGCAETMTFDIKASKHAGMTLIA